MEGGGGERQGNPASGRGIATQTDVEQRKVACQRRSNRRRWRKPKTLKPKPATLNPKPMLAHVGPMVAYVNLFWPYLPLMLAHVAPMIVHVGAITPQVGSIYVGPRLGLSMLSLRSVNPILAPSPPYVGLPYVGPMVAYVSLFWPYLPLMLADVAPMIVHVGAITPQVGSIYPGWVYLCWP